jgi:hypothetical protein
MDVITAAQNVAEDYKGGARQLAVDIDKNPTSLSHELSETGGAKLGLRTAVKMTRRTGDLRILNAFASEAGCMVLPLPEALRVEGNSTMHDLSQVAQEFADVVREVTMTAADDTVSDNEMERVLREWGELLAAGQRAIAGLQAKNQAAKPGGNLRAVG